METQQTLYLVKQVLETQRESGESDVLLGLARMLLEAEIERVERVKTEHRRNRKKTKKGLDRIKGIG